MKSRTNFQVYGMTEAAGLTHSSLDPICETKAGSVGPCAPNVRCKVVDFVTGSELGPNEKGELNLRGPQVMKGYLNNPAATSECLDRDGWYHTGDVGYADEDGCFYILDRLKELIKYKGFQVAPAELEAVLLSHPAIADAAVVPSPDEQAGEVPKAFLVTRNPVTVEEVLSFVAARVAPHKKIRRVEFVEQLPKSPAGKLLRRVLREREWRGTNLG
jgi:acyl-CoA synthetase (AMP-forming)/AMP-acid ligase II